MRSRSWIVVASMCFLGIQAASAQEASQAMSAEEQAMMEKWGAFMTPGEPHKLLAGMAGTWTVQVKFWMTPDAEPEISQGTSRMEMILDGRYMVEEYTGTFQGMPFLGRGLGGFDNLKQKYVSTWIDNMGTGIMTAEGTYDAASRTFEFMGIAPDPMAGEHKPMKTVQKLDADAMHIDMFSQTPDGKGWWRTMEMTYTRKK